MESCDVCFQTAPGNYTDKTLIQKIVNHVQECECIAISSPIVRKILDMKPTSLQIA
jgi:hypothetical protein